MMNPPNTGLHRRSGLFRHSKFQGSAGLYPRFIPPHPLEINPLQAGNTEQVTHYKHVINVAPFTT